MKIFVFVLECRQSLLGLVASPEHSCYVNAKQRSPRIERFRSSSKQAPQKDAIDLLSCNDQSTGTWTSHRCAVSFVPRRSTPPRGVQNNCFIIDEGGTPHNHCQQGRGSNLRGTFQQTPCVPWGQDKREGPRQSCGH